LPMTLPASGNVPTKYQAAKPRCNVGRAVDNYEAAIVISGAGHVPNVPGTCNTDSLI
jgi:hypothetical protein